MRDRIDFFAECAGFSYDPKTQTPDEGRYECAERLAQAEVWAELMGIEFAWRPDPGIDSSDFSDDPEPWTLWSCEMETAEGETLDYMGGIDFGRGGEPWGDNDKRVVEAEMALVELERSLHAFNTGARYTEHGQRIGWLKVESGVLFYDIDRMIRGKLRDARIVTDREVHDAYLRGDYSGLLSECESFLMKAIAAAARPMKLMSKEAK